MIEKTARLALPLLFQGQAQKEITHNEALLLLDAASQCSVAGISATPPAGLGEGDHGTCWIVGPGSVGSWTGQSGAIAIWTGGSWRFIQPWLGMQVFRADISQFSLFDGTDWLLTTPISGPSGGTVIDAEARTAIAEILALLKEIKLLAD